MREIEKQIELLKLMIEAINTEINVNMCLFQPGIEPLNIVGKSVNEILSELRFNLIVIFSKYCNQKTVFMNDNACKKIYGLECEELLKLAERINVLISVINISKQDEKFSKISFVNDIGLYTEKELNKICSNMIQNYLMELKNLIEDFQKFTITENQCYDAGMFCTTRISSPQMTSQLFRIFYNGNPNCYCTIADAIQDNQEKIAL